MLSDFRLAFRALSKSRGFTLVAVLTLALGIGANTTFFSVLYGVVLKGLPFPDAHELVEIKNLGDALGRNVGRVSPGELRDLREHQRSFTGIATHDVGRVTLDRADGAERVIHARITANLFPILGISPALGRNFEEGEEQAGRDDVVIVSHAFWQSHLGGNPDALGQPLRFNGATHTVVGVMPAGFVYEDPAIALWQPVDFSPRTTTDRSQQFLPAIARLAPGVSLATATADLARVARQLRLDFPDAYPAEADWKLGVIALRDSHFGHLRTPLGALMGSAGAVLLIVCVNVAIMFLLRAAVRRREMAIRLSLGAGRRHIIRQLLAESVVVCTLGGVAGMLLSVGAVRILKSFPPIDVPRLADVSLNVPVAAFSFIVLAIVTLLVGLAPAFAVLRTRVSEGLSQSARVTESRGAVRLRDALTVTEIALAVMLLVCGGLAVRSLQSRLRDDVGFTTEKLLTFKTNLTPQAYPDLAATNQFYHELSTKLENLPGVAAVAAISYLPLSNESQFATAVPLTSEFARETAGTSLPSVSWRVVRGPYFSTMGTTLVRGRFFDSSDHATAPASVIVNDAFVQQFWPNQPDVIGQQVRFGTGANAHVRTIVGVVHRMKHFGPGHDALPEVFVPHAQFYQRGMYTVLKLQGSATGLVPLVRARLAEIDPAIPMYFIETMEQRYGSALALPRFTAGLVGAFSSLALILAGVGIFGVTAYSVSQRSREFGIRFAIGASRQHVVGLVLGRVGRLALFGAILGTLAAFELAQLMTGLLFGVEPTDLPTLFNAALLIAATAVLASLVPLARALRVNPAEALRAE